MLFGITMSTCFLPVVSAVIRVSGPSLPMYITAHNSSLPAPLRPE